MAQSRRIYHEKILITTFEILFPYIVFSANFATALSYAEAGDPMAQRTVGVAFYFGQYGYGDSREPVDKNIDKGIYWLKLSSEGGNCFAAWFLVGIYHEGKGTDQSNYLAAEYFLLAAQRGNVKAQRNIAGFYYEGILVEQNYDTAYAWASIANLQEQGHENTQNLLGHIIPELKNRDESNILAAKLFLNYKEPQDDCENK